MALPTALLCQSGPGGSSQVALLCLPGLMRVAEFTARIRLPNCAPAPARAPRRPIPARAAAQVVRQRWRGPEDLPLVRVGCAGVAQLLKRPSPRGTDNVREAGVRRAPVRESAVRVLGFPAAGGSSAMMRSSKTLGLTVVNLISQLVREKLP